ncbi:MULTISPECIES: DUF350 domain-containing protein [Mycobacterium]|uniref:DUF350 domain-containing protein n=1 Tax=Mycobacterium syngnathidarum TaxID=1908205 RepID=A0A1S1KJV6_9MYCO|nr:MULTISPECIES: DUF350 domain-containing protein [Mycobacterium]MCG7610057.1 DUF350 domain-containing protein [Mycobacterium sp. CnD-18-1]OHU06892.1 hypothetical protein BKG61_06600 [Mycobacterium syngnathidarum]
MTTTLVALDSDYWSFLGHGVSAIVLYSIVGVALMILGFYVIDWTTPGPLRTLVQAGRPNAAAVAASGVLSMAFIVVIAIYSSLGDLVQGLITTLVFGLLGIAAQAVSVRLVGAIKGIDIGGVLASERFTPQVLVVTAAYVAFGLIIAAAIL